MNHEYMLEFENFNFIYIICKKMIEHIKDMIENIKDNTSRDYHLS